MHESNATIFPLCLADMTLRGMLAQKHKHRLIQTKKTKREAVSILQTESSQTECLAEALHCTHKANADGAG